MQPVSSSAIPIFPGYVASISSPRPFGTSPYRGFRGGDAGQMRGIYSGCGCAPGGSCGCSGLGAYDPGRAVYAKRPGMRGLGQTASLDQIIANSFNWLGGIVQSNLPASAAVPPQYGSAGAIGTQLTQWAPYIIIGFLAYKLIK